jgi:hypothetical protein
MKKTLSIACAVVSVLMLAVWIVCAWKFWSRVEQFERYVGESGLCSYGNGDDPYRYGNMIRVRRGGPQWLRDICGEYLCGALNEVDGVGVRRLSSRSLMAIASFPGIRVLYIGGAAAGSQSGYLFPSLQSLEVLAVSRSGLDDDGVAELTRSGTLKSLALLSVPMITDAGLESVFAANNLSSLMLMDTGMVTSRVTVHGI